MNLSSIIIMINQFCLIFHFFIIQNLQQKMRPQTAVQYQPSKRILHNQTYDYSYFLNQQGKQVKTNRAGHLKNKFVNNFSGFVNFKQRKTHALKDARLMYTQPKIQYTNKQGFIHPTGKKFNGYMQFPYNLKGSYPNHLDGQSFNQGIKNTIKQKNIEKILKQSKSLGSFHESYNNHTGKDQQINRLKSLKNLRKQYLDSKNFDLLNFKDETVFYQTFNKSKEENKQLRKQKIKQQNSSILQYGQKYMNTQQKQYKKYNQNTHSTFHTAANEIDTQSNSFYRTKNLKKSYFQLSLNNIQRTFNSNTVYSNFTEGKENQHYIENTGNFIDTRKNTFNTLSTNSTCYNVKCHKQKKLIKRRYMKKPCQQTINMNIIKVSVQNNEKQKSIVLKLKQQLKIYQPIKVIPLQTKENDTNRKEEKKNNTKKEKK